MFCHIDFIKLTIKSLSCQSRRRKAVLAAAYSNENTLRTDCERPECRNDLQGCTGLAMSALGQKRTLMHLRAMSALLPKADMDQHARDVRFVPKADIDQMT
jgi:hypothetical protein